MTQAGSFIPNASPRATPAGEMPYAPGAFRLAPMAALRAPLAFVAALALFGLLPSAQAVPALQASFWGAAAVLGAWAALLWVGSTRGGRSFSLEIVLRKQHYIQACAHISIFAYWGWYWPVVYDSAHLIAAQILFAYALDMLLVWSRRDSYTLGFGPLPIVFSTNLFLWFKPDWFYLQFVMIAVGFMAKELIRWEKDGRQVHIFNPSSFPLFLASLVLVTTGTTGITWGQEIANTFELPPYMRLWIFVAALPGQFLFGVVTMTLAAVATVTAFGIVYHAIFGTYYFVDAFVPAAVFLGMHLLFTDPSTAPRSELGRIVFGVMYGAAVIVLFGLLGALGVPTFYDKLLAVPVLNLTIQAIDRWAGTPALSRLDPSHLGRTLSARQRNSVYVAIWFVVFVIMSDPLAAYRPRRWVPLWEQACAEDRRNGCSMLSLIETRYCYDGSAWACNQLGALVASGRAPSPIGADEAFQRACDQGFQAGCANRETLKTAAAGPFQHAPPRPIDYPVLLQEGQGRRYELAPLELFAEACRQGWADGCGRWAEQLYFAKGAARDLPRALVALERACDLRLWPACANLGMIHRIGDGVPADAEKGRRFLKRACDGGFRQACGALDNPAGTPTR
jgi:hypothetical protein